MYGRGAATACRDYYTQRSRLATPAKYRIVASAVTRYFTTLSSSTVPLIYLPRVFPVMSNSSPVERSAIHRPRARETARVCVFLSYIKAVTQYGANVNKIMRFQ